MAEVAFVTMAYQQLSVPLSLGVITRRGSEPRLKPWVPVHGTSVLR